MSLICPHCISAVVTLLGTLGSLHWFRCRDCGVDFNVPAETDVFGDNDEDDER